jgi:hypothetical protein
MINFNYEYFVDTFTQLPRLINACPTALLLLFLNNLNLNTFFLLAYFYFSFFLLYNIIYETNGKKLLI